MSETEKEKGVWWWADAVLTISVASFWWMFRQNPGIFRSCFLFLPKFYIFQLPIHFKIFLPAVCCLTIDSEVEKKNVWKKKSVMCVRNRERKRLDGDELMLYSPVWIWKNKTCLKWQNILRKHSILFPQNMTKSNSYRLTKDSFCMCFFFFSRWGYEWISPHA